MWQLRGVVGKIIGVYNLRLCIGLLILWPDVGKSKLLGAL